MYKTCLSFQAVCKAWYLTCLSWSLILSSVCATRRPWSALLPAGPSAATPTGWWASPLTLTSNPSWLSCSNASWMVIRESRKQHAGIVINSSARSVHLLCSFTLRSCFISSVPILLFLKCIRHPGGGGMYRAGALSELHPGYTGFCFWEVSA